jgi:hypothetical protein
VDCDNHELSPHIPQDEIKIEELQEGDETDGDVIVMVFIDGNARKVAIEALSVSDRECLCPIDDTFYVALLRCKQSLSWRVSKMDTQWLAL